MRRHYYFPWSGRLVRVLFEDEWILALAKSRGAASVRLRDEDPATVSDYAVKYCKACMNASPDKRDGGLVQRLDFWTSGAMLAAKDRVTWQKLRTALQQEEVEKTYLALVEGVPRKKRQIIKAAFAVSKGMAKVRLAKARDKKVLPAVTSIELIAVGKGKSGWSVICATMCRGRRHQVRAHLASIGHPLIGDEQYGSKIELKDIVPSAKEGFLLHAETISLRHPQTGKKLFIEAPSAEFAKLLKKCRP